MKTYREFVDDILELDEGAIDDLKNTFRMFQYATGIKKPQTGTDYRNPSLSPSKGKPYQKPGDPYHRIGYPPESKSKPFQIGTPPKPAEVAKPKPSKLVKGGLETAVYAAGSVVADKAAKALTPSFVKGLAAVTGNTEKMKQRAPSLYGASGPDLTRNIAKGIVGRDAQQNFYQRVLNVDSKPKPAAPVAAKPKPKPAAPVAAKPKPAAKPVDPRLQKYRDLIKQGKHNMARDLGMQIHADKYGTPSPKTKSRNIA